MMTPTRRGRLILTAFTGAWGALLASDVLAQAPPPERMGVGWTMERLDLNVRVVPDQERIEVKGDMTLVLDGLEESFGPTIGINFNDALMEFDRVDAVDGDAETVLNATTPGFPEARLAHVRFPEALRRGRRVTVEFEYDSEGAASQFIITEHGALSSWTAAWYPFAIPRVDRDESPTVQTISVEGRTRLRLPADWIAITDGELRSRERSGGETVEVWDVSPPVARSFAAGPYRAATRTVDGRNIRVYMISQDKPITVDRLAGLMGEALAAQEAKLGPFPFPAYGVVEVPPQMETADWYAASQQTFIMADSEAFDYEHGNLPLWSHEMCHGWWGNTVGATGPGEKWVGESLAQLGALIAIEAIEGKDAAREFLEFSRSGYNTLQSALGYFYMWREGRDEPIGEMTAPGAWTHNLANSKGYWTYHMLREMIGDDVFFDVLRGAVRDFKGARLTTTAMRERFIAAAPEHDLETFFAQWLDRAGAPVLDLDWWSTVEDGVRGAHVEIRQLQGGEPFVFDLELGVTLRSGERIVRSVRVDSAHDVFEIETGEERPLAVELDPDRKVLLWRPSYGPRPRDGAPE